MQGFEPWSSLVERMGFDPTMRQDEWRGHAGPAEPPEELQAYIDALRWADACVFCFPTWSLGM
ncbi:MAG: hypothetical protein EOO62_37380, partial [Hymenobacter sp.]